MSAPTDLIADTLRSKHCMSDFLSSGDTFPSISLNLAGGGSFSFPQDLETPMTIALFYRGHW